MPSALLTLITLATCSSWFPRLVRGFKGNGETAGSPTTDNARCTPSASLVILLAPRTSVRLWSSCSNCCRAMYRGSLSGELGKPSSRSAVLNVVGAGAIASGCSTLPATKIGVPAADVIGGKAVVFRSAVLSAKRPPHRCYLQYSKLKSATDSADPNVKTGL